MLSKITESDKVIQVKRITAVCLLIILLCFAAACSANKSDEITTKPSYTQKPTEYSFPAIEDAYAEVTISEVFTEVSENIGEAVSSFVTEAKEPLSLTEANEETTAATVTLESTTVQPSAVPQTTEHATQPEPKSTTVKITVKEGMALTEIFKLLDEKGVADFDELMSTAQTYDYSYYPLVAAMPSNPNRCFRLEGYLFPDTYEFYYGQKPQDAIGRFLRNAKAKITDEMMSKASSMGYSMDEILTVASIIEKEGANSKEVAKIAAVIYNRLEAGMKLQMDCGIYYIERHVKPYISGDINRYNSFYNTYKCAALPAGPISNPGLRTINAALNPADVDYLYFCHDENANYYYALTYEEHEENLKKAGLL